MRESKLAADSLAIQGSYAKGKALRPPQPKRPRRELTPDHQLKPWARTLRRLMKAKKISQQRVADDTRIDKNTLSALMHGRDTNTRTLGTLAKYFQVSVSEFFLDESMPFSAFAQMSPQQFQAFMQKFAEVSAPLALMVAAQMARNGPVEQGDMT